MQALRTALALARPTHPEQGGVGRSDWLSSEGCATRLFGIQLAYFCDSRLDFRRAMINAAVMQTFAVMPVARGKRGKSWLDQIPNTSVPILRIIMALRKGVLSLALVNINGLGIGGGIRLPFEGFLMLKARTTTPRHISIMYAKAIPVIVNLPKRKANRTSVIIAKNVIDSPLIPRMKGHLLIDLRSMQFA